MSKMRVPNGKSKKGSAIMREVHQRTSTLRI